MRGAGFTQEEARVRGDINQKFLPVRAVMPWHRLPRGVVITPPWKCSSLCWTGFEQLALVKNVPTNGSGLEVNGL